MLVFAFLFFLAGCATPPGGITASPPPTHTAPPLPSPTTAIPAAPETGLPVVAPQVSPYFKLQVTSVEIRSLATTPARVELVIHGVLPDQCKYEFYAVETRAQNSVRISLDAIHPNDNSCAQTEQATQYTLALGRDLPEAQRGFAPGEYVLTVNEYQASFSIK